MSCEGTAKGRQQNAAIPKFIDIAGGVPRYENKKPKIICLSNYSDIRLP